jgi:hypothetical protein
VGEVSNVSFDVRIWQDDSAASKACNGTVTANESVLL